MKKIVLVLSLVALASPSHAAPKRNDQAEGLQKKCHEIMAKQEVEGEGRSHIGQLQMQRFSSCMRGEPY